MRKITFLAVIIVMLAIAVVPVAAQIPASYSSTVNVTNLSNSAGTIYLDFYRSDGTKAAQISQSIAAYETKWIQSFAGLATGFNGGLVISSSVPLASMSMLTGKNSAGTPVNYASYVGTSTGSGVVYLPLLMKSNYGYSTYFYVQNTSDAAVNVTINYSDGTSRTITNLKPSASVKIDNRLEAHSAKSFSAKLTSSGGDITAAAVEYSDGQQGDQLYAYGGFSTGTTKPIFPMVNENNYGYWTSVNIQNMGASPTTVTVRYSPSAAGVACTETQTIPAGQKRDFATYAFAFSASLSPTPVTTNCARYEKFIGGAAVITNSNNQPLVGIVNQINTNEDPNKGGALMSLNPTTASDTVVFPYVRQWDGTQQWFSSWTIINVSGTSIAAGDIRCHVVGTDSGGAVNTYITNPTSIVNGGAWLKQFYKNYAPLNNGFVGGAVCTTTSGKHIVGAANILAANAGIAIDSLAVYEGITP